MEIQKQRRLLEELREDNFDVAHFVDTLAWKALGSHLRNKALFNPSALWGCFERAVHDLGTVRSCLADEERRQSEACKLADVAHKQRLGELMADIEVLNGSFHELDTRIREVAAKVSHLGDHLDLANVPREKISEAADLTKHLARYCREQDEKDATSASASDDPLLPPVGAPPEKLITAANIAQKLHLLVQELPDAPASHFARARSNVETRYDALQLRLLRDFGDAQTRGDKERMQAMATALTNNSHFDACVETFIRNAQQDAFLLHDVFRAVEPLCQRTYELARAVFLHPESVMLKFVQNVFTGRLREHITEQLQHAQRVSTESYLNTLYMMFSETETLRKSLSVLHLGVDLVRLSKDLFIGHLATYIQQEEKNLKEKCATVLARYYAAIGHTRRPVVQSRLAEFSRDLKERLEVLHLPVNDDLTDSHSTQEQGGVGGCSGEMTRVLLSQEPAAMLVQEVSDAAKRAALLCPSPLEQAEAGAKLHEVLLHSLLFEHMEYGVDISLSAIPSESAAVSQLLFFETVREANLLFHLYEGKFSECLVPLLGCNQQVYAQQLTAKRQATQRLEARLAQGLDRLLNAALGYIRALLKAEQRASDFKPDEDSPEFSPLATQACRHVTHYVDELVRRLRQCLDGHNLQRLLQEFGLRFHRVLTEHLYTFQYSGLGGMVALCDVNAYRKAFFDSAAPMSPLTSNHSSSATNGENDGILSALSLVSELFKMLSFLVNLLVVQPDNIGDMCSQEPLNSLNKEVRSAFVQLRVDYKSIKARLPASLR